MVRSTMYFFPDSGVVSVVAVYADGTLRWQRLVGRVARVYKPSSAPRVPPSDCSSKCRGAQQRCRARRSPGHGVMPSFRSLMYAYVHAFLEQVLVSVACNGAHSLKQRLARWLLMMHDRGDDDALPELPEPSPQS